MLAIAQLGQPVLRRVADPVPADALGSPAFRDFLEQMDATLEESGGVGLAAPQVFASLRVFLAKIRVDSESAEMTTETFINPVLSFPTPDQESAWEGCLSFPELTVLVPRKTRVRLEYWNRNGKQKQLELEGFSARVVQHENDHLDGILTLDRAVSTRDIIKASELEAAMAATMN
jgi:peptide deformylase